MPQGKALRDSKSKTILVRYGSEVLSLRLQGFIFFFTAEKLRCASKTTTPGWRAARTY